MVKLKKHVLDHFLLSGSQTWQQEASQMEVLIGQSSKHDGFSSTPWQGQHPQMAGPC